MELIDKAVVVAKIKGLIRANELYLSNPETDEARFQKVGAYSVLNDLLHFINTLEAKGVDLENLFQALPEKIADEKSHQIYELSVYHYDGECVVDYVGELDHDSLYSFGGNTLYEAIEKAWNWLRENSTGG